MNSLVDEAYYEQLKELQTVDFVLVELNLYLDTHPQDLQALQQFNHFACIKQKLMTEFEAKYGPLQGFGNSLSQYPWQWVCTPWPWQV